MTNITKKYQNTTSDVFMLVLGVALVLISCWYFFTGYEVSHDALTDGRMISVTSRVNGVITEVYVEDSQEVKKGDLLMEINPQVYQAQLREAESELNHEKVRLLMCEKPEREDIIISDERPTKSLIDSKYTFNRNDLDKLAKMFSGNVQKRKDKLRPIPKKTDSMPQGTQVAQQYQTLCQRNTPNGKAFYQQSSSLNTQVNNQQLVNTVQPNKELEEQEEDYEMVDTVELREQIKALESKVADCKLNLSYTKVYATQDGIISARNVRSGDYVEIGDELINLVPKHVWIIANYKSSQADKMHEGQNVYIRISDYPKKIFKGMVESVDCIQENQKKSNDGLPQGSDIVPVRIVFTKDYSDYNFIPGTSVVTAVRIK